MMERVNKLHYFSTVQVAYAIMVILSICIAISTEIYAIATLPAIIIGIFWISQDIRWIYWGYFALLPYSVEVQFGSLGTDLPSEPILLILTGLGIVLFINKIKTIPKSIIYHPITVALLLHVLWIGIAAIFSQNQLISFKFFLAKIWYVVPMYAMTLFFLRKSQDVIRIFKVATGFLFIAIVIVLFRHSLEGFSFETSNEVVYPIFRNHVNYAAMLVVVLPYLVSLYFIKKSRVVLLAMFVYLLGIYFSYTRAAHLCVFIIIGTYFIFRYKLTRLAIVISLIGAILLSLFMVNDNKYLDYAPNFEKTIMHTEFDNLLEATYKMEDISTMERVYRWVAGAQLISKRPIIGYGPNGFYDNYTKYTVTSFETYVSDNPEKSGIHCYYLMTWVEQGIIGLIIFLAFIFIVLLLGERTYHDLKDPKEGWIVMACIGSMICICALLIINDLLEADKVGPFFFFNAAVITYFNLKSRRT